MMALIEIPELGYNFEIPEFAVVPFLPWCYPVFFLPVVPAMMLFDRRP